MNGGNWEGRWEAGRSNLDSTAETEDTVVGLLGRQTLDRLLDGLGLLGDQIIDPIVTRLVIVVGRTWTIGEFRGDRGERLRQDANGNGGSRQCLGTAHKVGTLAVVDRSRWTGIGGIEGRAIITSVRGVCSRRRRCTTGRWGSSSA